MQVNQKRIDEGHEEIDRLDADIRAAFDPLSQHLEIGVAAVRRMVHISKQVAPLVEVAERFGWNGVENSKILADFLEEELFDLGCLRSIKEGVAPDDLEREIKTLQSNVRKVLDPYWTTSQRADDRVAIASVNWLARIAREQSAKVATIPDATDMASALETTRKTLEDVRGERDEAHRDNRALRLRVAALEQNQSENHRTIIYANSNGARVAAEREDLQKRIKELERDIAALQAELNRGTR